eukprot:SAG11_NODE_59_length_19156_cov_11.188750_11_plen_152_part_00
MSKARGFSRPSTASISAEEQLRRHIVKAYESPEASSGPARTPSLEPASVWLLRTLERCEHERQLGVDAAAIDAGRADEDDTASCGGLTCGQVQECLKAIGVPPMPSSLAKILPGRYPKVRYRVLRKTSIRSGFDKVRYRCSSPRSAVQASV